jgi:hypothetical protein
MWFQDGAPTWLFARYLSSLVAIGRRFLKCMVYSIGCLSVLTIMEANFIHTKQYKRGIQKEALVSFYDLVSKIVHHYFCCHLFVRRQFLSLIHRWRKLKLYIWKGGASKNSWIYLKLLIAPNVFFKFKTFLETDLIASSVC